MKPLFPCGGGLSFRRLGGIGIKGKLFVAARSDMRRRLTNDAMARVNVLPGKCAARPRRSEAGCSVLPVVANFGPLAARRSICMRLLRTLHLDGIENPYPKIGKLFERRRAVQKRQVGKIAPFPILFKGNVMSLTT